MPSSKTQRWLDLLAVLVGHRFPISIDQIMEGVPAYRDRLAKDGDAARSTVRRMFERDKDELRRLGIPLETRSYRVDGMAEAEGYLILRRDLYLPYLKLVSEQDEPTPVSSGGPHGIAQVLLTEADARTAMVALREVIALPTFPFQDEARKALRKLTFDLDPALAQVPESAPRILDRPGGADPQGVMGRLIDSLHDRRRVNFRYHSIRRDAVQPREVEPWGLLFQWGAWYLLAHDPEKESDPAGVRLFRVDRMTDTRPARSGSSTPDFQVPDGFDAQAYAGRKAWELGSGTSPEIEVTARFLPPASLLAARNGWGEEVDGADENEGAATLRRFRVRRLDTFLRWALSMAGEVEIMSPPEAVAAMSGMASEILALYGRKDR